MSRTNHEPGYKALLVREETKVRLQVFRKSIKDRDFFQERQIATAAIEFCLKDPAVMQKVIEMAKEVVMDDWNKSKV